MRRAGLEDLDAALFLYTHLTDNGEEIRRKLRNIGFDTSLPTHLLEYVWRQNCNTGASSGSMKGSGLSGMPKKSSSHIRRQSGES